MCTQFFPDIIIFLFLPSLNVYAAAEREHSIYAAWIRLQSIFDSLQTLLY